MSGNPKAQAQGNDAERVATAKSFYEHLADNQEIEDKNERIAHAVEHGIAYSRARLKRELGLRPIPDAEPVSSYKNDYGQRIWLYRVADTVAIKRRTAPQSRAQRVNAKATGLRKSLSSRLNRRLEQYADAWREGRIVVIDTETTGLDNPEVIEIAAVEARSSRVLVNERVRPITQIEDGAAAIHGIRDADLTDAPRWPAVAEQLHAALPKTALLAAFNSDFDSRAYRLTCELHDVNPRRGPWLCVKRDVAEIADPDMGRYTNLRNAADRGHVTFDGEAHAALTDARVAAGVLDHWMGVRERIADQLAKSERILNRLKEKRRA